MSEGLNSEGFTDGSVSSDRRVFEKVGRKMPEGDTMQPRKS